MAPGPRRVVHVAYIDGEHYDAVVPMRGGGVVVEVGDAVVGHRCSEGEGGNRNRVEKKKTQKNHTHTHTHIEEIDTSAGRSKAISTAALTSEEHVVVPSTTPSTTRTTTRRNTTMTSTMSGDDQHDKTRIYPNRPCPCGSKKKYKSCCLPAQKAAERRRRNAEKEEEAWEEGLGTRLRDVVVL